MIVFSILVKFSSTLVFLNFTLEKLFVTIAYFALLTEVAETFGAMLVTSILSSFMAFSTSVTHSFALGVVATTITASVPQILSLSLVGQFCTINLCTS
mgnify:CR=1 FL=1